MGLQTSYTGTTDNYQVVYAAKYGCQTFTPANSHTVTSVKLMLQKTEAPAGVLDGAHFNASIRATSGGKPTGSDLCTGYIEVSEIGATEAEYEITLGAGTALTASTMYAIVVWMDNTEEGSAGDYVVFNGVTAGGGGYADGAWHESADSGATWGADVGGDHQFKEYSSNTDYTMAVTTGSYTLTGINIDFTKALNMAVTTGSYVLTGIDIALSRGYTMVVSTGSYILTGVDVILTKALNMTVTTGSYVLTGVDITFQKTINMIFSAGSYILTGFDIIFRSSAWKTSTKHSASATNTDKHSASITNTNKNNESVINSNKSYK